MPGRSRGRMFDIRPEHGVEDTGTGSYPGYPGYGDSDVEPYDEYEDHYAELDARRGREVPARDPGGAGRTGGRPGAPNGHAGGTAATTAVRAAGRGGTGRAPVPTGRAPVPGRPGPASGRFRTGDDEGRVAPDGRWDEDEPPLLSHRNEVDEPAYARDRTPQGFDGGDPDEPGWGRGAAAYDDEYDEHDDYGDHDEQHDDEDAYDEDEYGVGDAPLSVPPPGSGGRPLGPADVEELDPSMTDALARVDLGSVQVPVPYGAELKLEPAGAERPQAVHLLLPEGRIAVSALAAPRSSGLWPDLAAEIEQSLRKGGARVRNNRGDWGRELHARTENAASVFVGCDGPRWMVYGVATASLETVEALDVELRRVLRGIIVVRGRSPYPPRTVLPLELPEHLREAQPEVAPQKPSITVSVPRPAGESGATPAAGSTGATPAPPPTPTASPTAGTAATGAIPRPAARPAAEAPARRGAGPAPVRRPGGADADPATRALPSVPRRPAAGPAPVEDARERTSVAGPVPPEDPAQRTAVASAPPIPSAGDRRRRARPDRPDRSARTGGAVRRDAAGTGARPAPDRAPEPFAARAPEPAPARDPEPAAEPPERRDPAVAALSVTDLLAGTEADPARGGAASRDRSASPDPGTDSAPGTGDTAADTGDTGAGAGDTGAGNGRRSRRRRADRADPATRIDAADLLAGREADAAPEEPDRRAAMAIEDIPLADVPLMEATLDREPEPEPEPEPAPAPAPASDESLPRRSRRRRPATDDADDADDWLSAEIAASRRAGRHGGGSGTSVADLLASAGLDDSGTSAGRRHSAPDGAGEPAAPPEQADGEDLFRSPSAPSGSSTPSRPPALDGIPARGYLAGGPTSADEARSALQDLLRSASGPSADDTGHGGSGVTGLADYRASRAGRRNGTRSGTHDDAATTDPYATEPDDHDEELPGRAAGGSGAAHPWTSGRRAGGTGPGDLGRHRRD